jgi:hypothetical protein
VSAERIEALLARICVDPQARARFLADPRAEARRAGLDEADRDALAAIDVVGLELAADSFARKRARSAPSRRGLWQRLWRRS